MGGRFKRDGTYVYLRLIHVDVWQKPTKFYKAIILQLKSKQIKKRKKKQLKQCKIFLSNTNLFWLNYISL